MLTCSCTLEWQDQSMGEESICRRDAWRKWMTAQGLPDPVDIPPGSVREHVSHGIFRDPVADALAIHYWRFHHWLVGDTILYFAAAAQELLQHRVPLGTFYGYVLEHAKGRLLYEGHLDFDRVFASPLLDFVETPGFVPRPADRRRQRVHDLPRFSRPARETAGPPDRPPHSHRAIRVRPGPAGSGASRRFPRRAVHDRGNAARFLDGAGPRDRPGVVQPAGRMVRRAAGDGRHRPDAADLGQVLLRSRPRPRRRWRSSWTPKACSTSTAMRRS